MRKSVYWECGAEIIWGKSMPYNPHGTVLGAARRIREGGAPERKDHQL